MFALHTGFVNKNFQPFWFVECPAVREFITYLNHKLWDDDIPHKSSIASTVNAKVLQLEELTLAIVEVCSSCLNPCQSLPTIQKCIPSKVSTIWDGWSTRKWQPFILFSISFVDSPLNNNTLWLLKKLLAWIQLSRGQAHQRINWKGFDQHHSKISVRKEGEYRRLCNYQLFLILHTVGLDGKRWS